MLQGWLQIVVFFAVLIALVPLLGGYMARVFTGERVFLTRSSGRSSAALPRAARRRSASQGWKSYARQRCSSSPACSGCCST